MREFWTYNQRGLDMSRASWKFPAQVLVPGLLVLLVSLASPAFTSAAAYYLCPYDGPITPVAADFIIESLERAHADSASVFILQLDTPGGLDSSMREIIKAQLASEIPLVVFVGPGGSRAASAGAFITLAGHLAVMAPGTNIGSASPVQMGGAMMDSTMASKVKHDAEAYIASLADRHDRDSELARSMVSQALNFTAQEALDKGLIDLIAPTVPALIDSLRGRGLVVGEREISLPEESPELITVEMTARQKFLKRLADPNLAYLLMLLGIYGLFFELSNPGALVPGILGGISLLLALFAFQTLPVDYTGVALILLGVVMFLLEIKVPSYGALSIGGLVSLVLGSLMLFDSGEQWARVSWSVLVPAVLVFGGFFLLCVWLAIRGQKRQVTTGPDALVGKTGRVLEAIGPEQPGKVVCNGEIWRATASEEIAEKQQIIVRVYQGRTLEVEPSPSE